MKTEQIQLFLYQISKYKNPFSISNEYVIIFHNYHHFHTTRYIKKRNIKRNRDNMITYFPHFFLTDFSI